MNKIFLFFLCALIVFIGVFSSSVYVKRISQTKYDAAQKEEIILNGQFIGEWSQIAMSIKNALKNLGYADVQEHPWDQYNRTEKEIWTNSSNLAWYRGEDITLPTYIRFYLKRENEEAKLIQYSIKLFRIETPDRPFYNLDSHYSPQELKGPIRKQLEGEFAKWGLSTDPSQFEVNAENK